MDLNSNKVLVPLSSRKASLTPIIHTVPWDFRTSWWTVAITPNRPLMRKPPNTWHNIRCNKVSWSLHKFTRVWKVYTTWPTTNSHLCRITIKYRTTTRWSRHNITSILNTPVMETFSTRDHRLKPSSVIRASNPITTISSNTIWTRTTSRRLKSWSKLRLQVPITARISSSICTNRSLGCLQLINKPKTSPDWGKIPLWSSRSMCTRDSRTRWTISRRRKISRWHLSTTRQLSRLNSIAHNSRQRWRSLQELTIKSSRLAKICQPGSNFTPTRESRLSVSLKRCRNNSPSLSLNSLYSSTDAWTLVQFMASIETKTTWQVPRIKSRYDHSRVKWFKTLIRNRGSILECRSRLNCLTVICNTNITTNKWRHRRETI